MKFESVSKHERGSYIVELNFNFTSDFNYDISFYRAYFNKRTKHSFNWGKSYLTENITPSSMNRLLRVLSSCGELPTMEVGGFTYHYPCEKFNGKEY
jgi:hypothetical protein